MDNLCKICEEEDAVTTTDDDLDLCRACRSALDAAADEQESPCP